MHEIVKYFILTENQEQCLNPVHATRSGPSRPTEVLYLRYNGPSSCHHELGPFSDLICYQRLSLPIRNRRGVRALRIASRLHVPQIDRGAKEFIEKFLQTMHLSTPSPYSCSIRGKYTMMLSPQSIVGIQI